VDHRKINRFTNVQNLKERINNNTNMSYLGSRKTALGSPTKIKKLHNNIIVFKRVQNSRKHINNKIKVTWY